MGDNIIIEVPSWCTIGTWVEWSCPSITGCKWVHEKIISYGYDGFYHQYPNCPIYYSKFSDLGKTIRLIKNISKE